MVKTYYNMTKKDIDSKKGQGSKLISISKFGPYWSRKKLDQKNQGAAPLMKQCEAAFKFKCRQRLGNEKSVRGLTKHNYEDISQENLSEISTSDSNSNDASEQIISKSIVISDKKTFTKLPKFGRRGGNLDLLSSSFEVQKDLFENLQKSFDKQLFTSCSGRHFSYSNIVGNTDSSLGKEFLRNNFVYSNKDKGEKKEYNDFLQEAGTETLDTIPVLQYNPIIDMWPIFLSDLECSMIPSLNCYDSINWDKIDNLPFYKNKSMLENRQIADPLQVKEDNIPLNDNEFDDYKPFSELKVKVNEITPYNFALEDVDHVKNHSLLQQSLSVYNDHNDNILQITNTNDLLKTVYNSFSDVVKEKQDLVTNFLDKNECSFLSSKTPLVLNDVSPSCAEMDIQFNDHNSFTLQKKADLQCSTMEEDNTIVFVEDFDVNREVFEDSGSPDKDNFSKDNTKSLPASTPKENSELQARPSKHKSSSVNATFLRTDATRAKPFLTLAEFQELKMERKNPTKYVTSQGKMFEISSFKTPRLSNKGETIQSNSISKSQIKSSNNVITCDKSCQSGDIIPKFTFNSTSSPSSSKNTVITTNGQYSSAKNSGLLLPSLRYFPINKSQKTTPSCNSLPKPPPLKFIGTDIIKVSASLPTPFTSAPMIFGNFNDKNKSVFSSNRPISDTKCKESVDKIETTLPNNLPANLPTQFVSLASQNSCTSGKITQELANTFTVDNRNTILVKSFNNKKIKIVSNSSNEQSLPTQELSSKNDCPIYSLPSSNLLSEAKTRLQDANLNNTKPLNIGVKDSKDQVTYLYKLLVPVNNSSNLKSTFSLNNQSQSPYSKINFPNEVVSNTVSSNNNNNLDQSIPAQIFQESINFEQYVACSNSSSLNSVCSSKPLAPNSPNCLYNESIDIKQVVSKSSAVVHNNILNLNFQVPVPQDDQDIEANWFNPVIENCFSLSNNSSNDFPL